MFMKTVQKKHISKTKRAVKNRNTFLSASNNNYYIIFILILTAIVFSNTINNGFTNWDDDKYLFENPYIKNLSFDGIKAVFNNSYFFNYHPITTLSYAVENSFFGWQPKVYHFTNYILHLLNTLLVFVFIKQLFKRTEIPVIAALLFALHPMHVESVAWIAERKDVLYTFFFLASLIYYVKFVKTANKNLIFIFISFLLFLFSLMSKSAAVTWPVIMLLCAYFINKKISLKDIIISLPFFIISFIFGIIALNTQEHAMGDLSTIYANINRVLIVTYPIYFYIIRFIAPYNFSTLHIFPKPDGNMLPMEYYIAPFVIIIIIVLVFLTKKELRHVLIFGLLFFIINSVLIIQVVAVGQAIVAERYTYVPYIGFSVIAAHIYIHLKDRYGNKIIMSVSMLYLVFLIVSTWQQNKVWKDSLSMWNQAIKANPLNDFAYCFRGNEKANRGDKKGAIEDYDKSIEINPRYAVTYNNRANNRTDYSKAIEDYNKAIELLPTYAEAYYNRGNATFNLGKYAEAIADYNKALDLNFNNAVIFHNRGAARNQLGDYKNAITDFNKAIAIDPKYIDAFKNRGAAEYNLKDLTNACLDWKKAKEMGGNADDFLKLCK